MAARQLNAKKPQDLRYTLRMLLSYMGRHKFILLLVAMLVTVSALANLLGTYMIRPVVNNLADGNVRALAHGRGWSRPRSMESAHCPPTAIRRRW